MLCEVCSRMFSSGVKDGNRHANLESFTKAAAEGCYICAPFLRDAMKEASALGEDCFNPEEGYSYISTSSVIPASTDFKLLAIDMEMEKSEEILYWYRCFIAVPQAVLPVGMSVSGRGSVIPMNECLPVAQEWMSSCLDKHEQCQKHTQPHTYPTRLLDLGGHNCRLIVPQDHKLLGPYAALSYCWGPNPNFLRLTADNLQEFRGGIPYTRLPIAFQEAILIVKELGIRYIWIDALCIIQSGRGSIEDWRSESGRMQEVYSNCIINLSLAQATRPDQSCLGGYNLDCTPPFEADIVDGADVAGSRTYTILSQDYFQEALYDQPISSRAWVMQERLLATRVLSIGHGELFWDCQQVQNASESLPYGFALCSDLHKDYITKNITLSVTSILRIPSSENLEKTWFEIIEEYTARELTYPAADKLAAISAIATRMGDAMNDTYVSGHFLKTLPGSLGWSVQTTTRDSYVEQRAHNRLPKSSGQMVKNDWIITPSWSWASMNGRLTMQISQRLDKPSVAAMEGYRFSTVGQRGLEAQVGKKLMLTIRTWCHIVECKSGGPKIDDPNGLFFYMDDIHDVLADETQYLLAALVGSSFQVDGLLLKEIDFDGNKVFERMGYFEWIFHLRKTPINGSWKALFTHGEHSITLC
jgi:hypothetical protein